MSVPKILKKFSLRNLAKSKKDDPVLPKPERPLPQTPLDSHTDDESPPEGMPSTSATAGPSGPSQGQADTSGQGTGPVVQAPASRTNWLPSNIDVGKMEERVNRFMEECHQFMKALDEVAKIHPCVKVAILAFKTVWTMEMKRRGNDKKVMALYVEMKDMMSVLLQLKDIDAGEVNEIAPDGTTTENTLKKLAEKAADDIKNCGNLCDTYNKKKLVVKVLNSSGWEARLVHYVERFVKRRTEFQFALTVHTARGLDLAKEGIMDLKAVSDEIHRKMDVLFQHFTTTDSEQNRISEFIEVRGGVAVCRNNLEILSELAELESTVAATHHSGHDFDSTSSFRLNRTSKNSLVSLIEDLTLSIDESLQENLNAFIVRFEGQQRQLKKDLVRVVRRESDRVIGALVSSTYTKIHNEDIAKLWRKMDWRGSVKSRQFVQELAEFLPEEWCYNVASVGQDPPALERRQADEWALVYLMAVRLQPSVMEAFDEDNSGFVTTSKVNHFTSACPPEWSLPHWIAYWAIGWEQAMAHYIDAIKTILEKMFGILPHIQQENQNFVNRYISEMYPRVRNLTQSFKYCKSDIYLQTRFASYIEAEEARLRENLEAVNYDIQTSDALDSITGAGRLERFILPVIYLLLARHFEICRVAQTQLLHSHELWRAENTLSSVFMAIKCRVDTLKSTFRQRTLDVEQQLQNFAHGLYNHRCWGSDISWTMEEIRSMDIPELPYNDYLEASPPRGEFCNYPLDKSELDHTIFDTHLPSPTPTQQFSPALNAILGTWNGYIFDKNMSTAGMIIMTFYQKDSEGSFDELVASGRSNVGEWHLTGSCRTGEDQGIVEFNLIREFTSGFPPQHWEGQVNIEQRTFTGKLKPIANVTSDQPCTFFFSRQPEEYLCYRPVPALLQEAKERPVVLWHYAINAVLNQIRRKKWTWSYFAERRRNRQRLIELFIRNQYWGKPLSNAEQEELGRINLRLRATDSRYYHALALQKIRTMVGHPGISCANCGGNISGGRVVCLVCRPETKHQWSLVNLCEAAECLTARPTCRGFVGSHCGSHDVFKTRRVLHTRHVWSREQSAAQALARCQKYMDSFKWRQGRENEEWPGCILCGNKVGIPCWYCIECQENAFICDGCDSRDASAWVDYEGPHKHPSHDLVRCQMLMESSETTVEDRLTSLEQGMSKIGSRLERRMSRMETLLETLLAQGQSKINA